MMCLKHATVATDLHGGKSTKVVQTVVLNYGHERFNFPVVLTSNHGFSMTTMASITIPWRVYLFV